MLFFLIVSVLFWTCSAVESLATTTTILTTTTVTIYASASVSASPKPLSFTDQGIFQIAIFNDLHFGENAWDQWGSEQDLNTVNVMNAVLDAESPQLVVLNGDLITGTNAYFKNSTLKMDQLLSPLLQRNLPWASTYGNHDSAYNLSRLDILAHERRYPNALTTQMIFGPNSGVSNYYLPVYPPHCAAPPCPPDLILWFFDSRGGEAFQVHTATGAAVSQPDWVDTSVVSWFQDTNTQLTAEHGGPIPSLAFVHIPPHVSQLLQAQGVDPHRQPGINDDHNLAAQGQNWCAGQVEGGSRYASCEYGGQDGPFMAALAATPGVMALFSGHDHGNSWCYRWDRKLPGMSVKGNGVNLCFGQHSGYGGYGTWIRGSRQVVVNLEDLAEGKCESWIRLEDGEVVGRVELNATYGQDVYAAVEEEHTTCEGCDYGVISDMPGTG